MESRWTIRPSDRAKDCGSWRNSSRDVRPTKVSCSHMVDASAKTRIEGQLRQVSYRASRIQAYRTLSFVHVLVITALDFRQRAHRARAWEARHPFIYSPDSAAAIHRAG